MRALLIVLSSLTSCCWAAAAEQRSATPDQRDYVIETIQRQRNEALTREALCRGELSPEIDRLRAEIAELKKQSQKREDQ